MRRVENMVLRDINDPADIMPVVSQPGSGASLVKGKVTDQDGQGIKGVDHWFVKGTTSGTTTDSVGSYAFGDGGERRFKSFRSLGIKCRR